MDECNTAGPLTGYDQLSNTLTALQVPPLVAKVSYRRIFVDDGEGGTHLERPLRNLIDH